jgi:crossover junction endodeoxyribonuclease RuvC
LTQPLTQPVKKGTLRILGIDPGTLRLGYGVVDVASGAGVHVQARIRYVDCGVITAPARDSREARLLTIGRDLRDLLAELGPQVVAMEQAFFGKNVQSTLALGEARGVALFVAQEHGASLAGYPPARVKQVVTGRGAASKEEVAFFVRALMKMRRTPAADAADALAIALCHARLLAAPAAMRASRRSIPLTVPVRLARPRGQVGGAR